MKPTFGSAFAGIGGFELGLERAGWECRWQIENDKFCNRVLEKRWPDIKRYGDIEDVDTKELEAVDLVCGGFPCQDLSVAGKRGGLSGERSGLFWELVRLVRGVRPRWLLIENVPGFLSSNEGEDFALAIETLAELGYGLAWRVLDSQYFGVPQRRRRVFIVGHLGAMCPPEILFESEGGEGDITEGGKAGEGIAYSLAARPGTGGGARLDPNQETLIAGFSAGQSAEAGSIAYEEERSPTLKGEPSGTNQVPSVIWHNKGQDFDLREYEEISPAVTERWGTGGGNVPIVPDGDPNGGGLRRSSDRGGRQADAGGEPDERQEDGGVPGPEEEVIAFESRIIGDDGRGYEREPRIRKDGIAWTIQASAPGNVSYLEGVRPRMARPALGRLGEGDDGEEVDPDGVREAPRVPRRVDLSMLGFRNLEVQREVVGTLMGHGDPSRKAGINDLPIVFDWRSGGDVRLGISEERANPLHSRQAPAVMTKEMEEFAQRVKQTIKHCLQCPDSPRYRALGNAVTVQVAEWIGRRIIHFSDGEP